MHTINFREQRLKSPYLISSMKPMCLRMYVRIVYIHSKYRNRKSVKNYQPNIFLSLQKRIPRISTPPKNIGKKMRILLLALMPLLLHGLEEGCDDNFLCTDFFCMCQVAPKDCHIPDGEECNGVLLPLYDNTADFCSCCPWRCVEYLSKGDHCSVIETSPYPQSICGPQLSKCLLAKADVS